MNSTMAWKDMTGTIVRHVTVVFTLMLLASKLDVMFTPRRVARCVPDRTALFPVRSSPRWRDGDCHLEWSYFRFLTVNELLTTSAADLYQKAKFLTDCLQCICYCHWRSPLTIHWEIAIVLSCCHSANVIFLNVHLSTGVRLTCKV